MFFAKLSHFFLFVHFYTSKKSTGKIVPLFLYFHMTLFTFWDQSCIHIIHSSWYPHISWIKGRSLLAAPIISLHGHSLQYFERVGAPHLPQFFFRCCRKPSFSKVWAPQFVWCKKLQNFHGPPFAAGEMHQGANRHRSRALQHSAKWEHLQEPWPNEAPRKTGNPYIQWWRLVSFLGLIGRRRVSHAEP